MISKVIEINDAPPSQNVWERMNRYQKPKLMLRFREIILLEIGEGPWPKVYLKATDKIIRDRVVEDLKKDWPKKRTVYIEINIRRKVRFDGDNSVGGCKPLFDAIQWAGWCVTDHCKWLRRVFRPQVNGDPKTILQVWVPENASDERELESRFDGQWI